MIDKSDVTRYIDYIMNGDDHESFNVAKSEYPLIDTATGGP
jgi:hypothetical protein